MATKTNVNKVYGVFRSVEFEKFYDNENDAHKHITESNEEFINVATFTQGELTLGEDGNIYYTLAFQQAPTYNKHGKRQFLTPIAQPNQMPFVIWE